MDVITGEFSDNGIEFSETDFWTWDSRCSGKLRVVNIELSMLGMTP